jgi:dUTP pyrophosphatase
MGVQNVIVNLMAGWFMKHNGLEALFKHGLMERLMQSPIFQPPVDWFKVPGGRLPVRMTNGAIGFDAFIRSIVSVEKEDNDPKYGYLRRSLYDFDRPADDPRVPEEFRPHIYAPPPESCCNDRAYAFKLMPGKRVTVGVGFVTSMPHQLKYWVAPRSGLSSRHHITISNAPGTVDPDYRGEAAANVVNLGDQPFDLTLDTRIVQISFSWAMIPKFRELKSYEEFDQTNRGAGGFGSTGLTG